MKKSILQRLVCCFAVLLLAFCAGANTLGLSMPAHTNSYLSLSATGGTLMYGSGHASPAIPDTNAYYYLSGVGLGRGAAYSGTVLDNVNLVSIAAALNQIANPEPLGIKLITNGTNAQGWNLGGDVYGQDWAFSTVTWIEERIYSPGDPATVESALFYGDQKIITFEDSDVYMSINYMSGLLNGYSDACTYTKVAGLEGDASDIADAFIADFDRAGGLAVLLYDSIDPIVQEDGTAIINGSPAPLDYALYTWVGRIQTAQDGPVCLGILTGDLNSDCCVNLLDLVIMAQNWGQCNWEFQGIKH